MTNRQIVAQLKQFSKKADKLMNLDFINLLLTTKPGVTVAAEDERSRSTSELIDAFVQTFSFFIEDGEEESFEKISEVYSTLIGFDVEKNELENIRVEINGFLDSASNLDVGRNLTKRELMGIFIYGALAGENKSKKKTYDNWVSTNVTEAIITNRFIGILVRVFESIANIRRINEAVIAKLANVG